MIRCPCCLYVLGYWFNGETSSSAASSVAAAGNAKSDAVAIQGTGRDVKIVVRLALIWRIANSTE